MVEHKTNAKHKFIVKYIFYSHGLFVQDVYTEEDFLFLKCSITFLQNKDECHLKSEQYKKPMAIIYNIKKSYNLYIYVLHNKNQHQKLKLFYKYALILTIKHGSFESTQVVWKWGALSQ